MIKISIIIPLYNVAEYIEQCLQSIVNQTYKGAIECIIVDDCGTDNSIAIAEQFVATYQGLINFRILHHEHNQGLSAARNTGLDNAMGDYVYFLDSDDWISSDCISILTKPLGEKQYDMVVGDYQIEGEDWGVPKLYLDDGMYEQPMIMEDYCAQRFYMMACGKLCNKSFLINNKLYFKKGILHEDDLWSFLVATRISSMYVVKQKTYHYFLHNNSINGVSYSRQSLQHRDGYAATLLAMSRYSQTNSNRSIHFENRIYDYFEKVRKISNEINVDFKLIYLQHRQYYKYKPLYAWRKHQIRKKRFLYSLHYWLPYNLGYQYVGIIHKLIKYDHP